MVHTVRKEFFCVVVSVQELMTNVLTTRAEVIFRVKWTADTHAGLLTLKMRVSIRMSVPPTIVPLRTNLARTIVLGRLPVVVTCSYARVKAVNTVVLDVFVFSTAGKLFFNQLSTPEKSGRLNTSVQPFDF